MNACVVIGAGPAGCAAAILLARLGVRVTLVEKKPFPRIKVCGEYISPAGTDALERLLTPDDLRAAGARRVGSMALELGDRTVEWRTPREAWCVSRRTLDEVLRDRAHDAGVDIRQPASVRSVDYHDDHAALTLATGDTLTTDAVLHADGLARHDPAGPTPMAKGIVGFKCHYRPAKPVIGVRMRTAPGAYIGTVGVEGGLATCALVARSSVVKHHAGDADALVRALWPAWDPALRESDWLSCGVARSPYTEPGHPRSVRLGNAAAAVDPVGGEGIGLALWSAATFADAFDRTRDLARAKQALATAYRQRLRARRWSCRFAAEALMHPGLVRAAWPLLARRGEGTAALALWYRASGKPG